MTDSLQVDARRWSSPCIGYVDLSRDLPRRHRFLGSDPGASYPHLGGIAVDALGNAFVTGVTYSTDFPIASAFETANGGGPDAFVAELTPSGTSFVTSSYLGGNSTDLVFGIAVDGAGNTYVTGSTASLNFPTK